MFIHPIPRLEAKKSRNCVFSGNPVVKIADDSFANWELYYHFITMFNVDHPFLWVVSNTTLDFINYRRMTKLFKGTIENS